MIYIYQCTIYIFWQSACVLLLCLFWGWVKQGPESPAASATCGPRSHNKEVAELRVQSNSSEHREHILGTCCQSARKVWLCYFELLEESEIEKITSTGSWQEKNFSPVCRSEWGLWIRKQLWATCNDDTIIPVWFPILD